MKSLRGLRKYEIGLSLFEVMAAMVIMSMIVAGTISMQANEARDKFADHAASMSIRVQNAARSHRGETGSWPTGTAQLVSAGRLTAAEAISPFNTSYSFSVNGNNLRVSANATNSTYARRLSGILPGGSSSGVSYSFQFPPAGSEVSLAGLYKRDGSDALTGSMNANGNSINNVSTLNAAQVNGTNINGTNVNAANITATNVVNTNHFTATGNVRGGYVESTGNMYAANQLSVGNQIVAANNITSNGTINAAGEIYGGSLRAAGNVNGQNIFASGTLSGQTVYGANSITTEGILRAHQIFTTGNIQTYGNIEAEDIRAGGSMYGRRFIDYDDPATFFDPSGNSRLTELEVRNGFILSGRHSEGASCNAGQLGFNAANELIICKDSFWRKASENAQQTYTQGDETSITMGKLIIKMGLTEIGSTRTKSVFFKEAFPPGTTITSTCGMGTARNGGNPAHCDANISRVLLDNNNGSTKDFYWQVIGVTP